MRNTGKRTRAQPVSPAGDVRACVQIYAPQHPRATQRHPVVRAVPNKCCTKERKRESSPHLCWICYREPSARAGAETANTRQAPSEHGAAFRLVVARRRATLSELVLLRQCAHKRIPASTQCSAVDQRAVLRLSARHGKRLLAPGCPAHACGFKSVVSWVNRGCAAKRIPHRQGGPAPANKAARERQCELLATVAHAARKAHGGCAWRMCVARPSPGRARASDLEGVDVSTPVPLRCRHRT
jgi:hypothetical protein